MNAGVPRRTVLLVSAVALYVASCAGFGERLDARGRQTPPPSGRARLSVSEPDVERVIARDPFAGAPPEPGDLGSGKRMGTPIAASDERGVMPALARSGLAVPDLPDPPAAPPQRPLVLRATIVGNPSVAYVQDGAKLSVVRLGDVVETRRVTEIDLSGVSFDDGSRLDISDEAPQPDAPHRELDPVARLMERLRALVRAGAARRPRATAGGEPRGGTTAAPTPNTVTPGPLPTIVPGFLPVGSSPTSDPNAPAPAPLPPLRPPYPRPGS